MFLTKDYFALYTCYDWVFILLPSRHEKDAESTMLSPIQRWAFSLNNYLDMYHVSICHQRMHEQLIPQHLNLPPDFTYCSAKINAACHDYQLNIWADYQLQTCFIRF